tara:strand:- start:155 stop:973 length:819 start_codon:yes stop_codon:yes gene_type:complete
MNKNILITGVTGFLGRKLANRLLKENYNIVGIAHSEKRVYESWYKFAGFPIYCLDLAHNKNELNDIVKKHEINCVIHCAAMKHVGLCEENPYRAIEVNVIGSKNIIDVAYDNGVDHVVGISTDKSINPLCVYGCSKMLMEKMFLEKGHSICRGVNFLFSDGSVLDIWKNQKEAGHPINVNSSNTTRFFITVEDFIDLILQNLTKRGKIINPTSCYKIRLHDLAEAFCELHDHSCVKQNYENPDSEKLVEEIPSGISVIDTTVEDIKKILKQT